MRLSFAELCIETARKYGYTWDEFTDLPVNIAYATMYSGENLATEEKRLQDEQLERAKADKGRR